ncbi:MAG TPA: glycosyltransferase [Mucilaginibacter sp.]|jgi:lipopolysaccharide biosynthesis glycosyltransferase|nr:glycosyltransferase [Mucilaginibacter sp.]
MGLNDNNRISILLVTDDYYAILLAAFLKSIEMNHKTDEIIDAYIIDDNISQKKRKKIINSLKLDKMVLHWIKMKDAIPENISLPFVNNSYPINTYLRVIIPYFIPKTVKKILYLDVDMIMLNDISLLWNTDIGEYPIGAVSDSMDHNVKTIRTGIINHEELGLNPDEKYFNAGLIIIDIDKWLAGDYTKKTFDAINNNKKYAGLGDQYGLNIAFIGKWHEIDPLWSTFSISTIPKPNLIHYFHRKPIFKEYANNYRDEFYHYLNQTEWKGFKPMGKSSHYVKKAKNLIQKIKLFLGK